MLSARAHALLPRVWSWPQRCCSHHEQLQPQAPLLSGTLLPSPSHKSLSLYLLSFWIWTAADRLHGFEVMYQSPRLVYPQGNDRNGAGHRSSAAPASVPVHHTPLTPRKTGVALDNLLRSLEHQYQLGFKNKSEWSPARSKTAADVVAKKIQHLFFSSRTDLEDALAAFAKIATSTAQNERLGVLSNILRSKVPRSRTGTPTSTKNVPPRSLDTAQPCKYIQARSHTITRQRAFETNE